MPDHGSYYSCLACRPFSLRPPGEGEGKRERRAEQKGKTVAERAAGVFSGKRREVFFFRRRIGKSGDFRPPFFRAARSVLLPRFFKRDRTDETDVLLVQDRVARRAVEGRRGDGFPFSVRLRVPPGERVAFAES